MNPVANRTQSQSSTWPRIVVLLAGAAAIWIGLGAGMTALFGTDYTFAAHAIRAPLTFALVAGLLLLILGWERASPEKYGLIPNRRTALFLALGAGAYLVPFVVTAVIVSSLGLASVRITGSLGEAILQLLAVVVLVLLYEAIPEELIFRGYIFAAVSNSLPKWATVLIQATLFCAFGFAIGAARTPDRLLLFFIFSLSLGVVRAASGSVFATIGFHAAFQITTQPLLGPQWTAFALDDPERWFSDLAFGLGPLLFGPLLVVLLVRARRRRAVTAA